MRSVKSRNCWRTVPCERSQFAAGAVWLFDCDMVELALVSDRRKMENESWDGISKNY